MTSTYTAVAYAAWGLVLLVWIPSYFISRRAVRIDQPLLQCPYVGGRQGAKLGRAHAGDRPRKPQANQHRDDDCPDLPSRHPPSRTVHGVSPGR